MVRSDEIREHMEVIGADDVHVGTVDKVEGDRIKLTKKDSGSHSDHHHYISMGMVATVEGDRVRLSATGANAALMEEEEGGDEKAGLARQKPQADQLPGHLVDDAWARIFMGENCFACRSGRHADGEYDGSGSDQQRERPGG